MRSPDKATAEGLMPLELILREMRYLTGVVDDMRPKKSALDKGLIAYVRELRELAKGYAPYMHPRLGLSAVYGPEGDAVQHQHRIDPDAKQELARWIIFTLNEATRELK